jgi:[acyl-carrier-protein] S-malonyltransferase
VLNCTAMFTNDADEIRKDLKIQCTHAVRWCESIKQMAAINIKACVEVGFGRTLMGLNRSIDRNLPTWTTEKPEAIDKFVKASAVVLGKQVS